MLFRQQCVNRHTQVIQCMTRVGHNFTYIRCIYETRMQVRIITYNLKATRFCAGPGLKHRCEGADGALIQPGFQQGCPILTRTGEAGM
jgi:hypothetical protein